MEDLVLGLGEYIRNSSLYEDIDNEIYFESNPAELDKDKTIKYPYIVYNLGDENETSDFCKSEISEFPLMITIVSDQSSPAEMFALQKKVKKLFRFAEFNVPNHSLTYCMREGGYYDRVPTTPRTWQFVENYRIRIKDS